MKGGKYVRDLRTGLERRPVRSLTFQVYSS